MTQYGADFTGYTCQALDPATGTMCSLLTTHDGQHRGTVFDGVHDLPASWQ